MKVFRTALLSLALMAGATAITLRAGAFVAPETASKVPAERATLAGNQVQKMIDALPRADGVLHGRAAQGGVVTLPPGDIDIGERPLRVWSLITLKGAGIGATRIVYRGEGAAIRLGTRGESGYVMHAGVEALTIYSEKGDGVSLDDGPGGTSITESGNLRLKDVCLNVAGTAIRFRNVNGQTVYFPQIDNVLVMGAGAGVLDFKGTGLDCNRLQFSNNWRGKPKDGYTGGAVRVDGSGAFTNCHMEDDWGGPLVTFSGIWRWFNNYNEAKGKHQPQFVLDGGWLTADLFLMVRPSYGVVLKNGSRLTFAAETPAIYDDGSEPSARTDKPDELARVAKLKADLRRATYVVDEKSSVRDGHGNATTKNPDPTGGR